MEKTRAELLEMYSYVGPFVEGLACARKDGKEFHIRPDGTPAYEGRYEFVNPFQGGKALVYKNEECFYIRSDGTRVDGTNS